MKDVVQTASVLGREFELRLLMQMLESESEVSEKVMEAERAAIWSALSEIRYIFKHALLRDARTVYIPRLTPVYACKRAELTWLPGCR